MTEPALICREDPGGTKDAVRTPDFCADPAGVLSRHMFLENRAGHADRLVDLLLLFFCFPFF